LSVKIAISGKSGCGNSTVSRIVAKRLGYKLVNYTFHSTAQEIGVSFEEMCDLAEQDDKWDIHVDECQVEMAREGDTVLGSRLAIWMLDDADFRVYLDARLDVRGERIHKREGGDLEQIRSRTTQRDQRDHDRYLRLYGIDNNKYQFVDLVVDTEDRTPEEIADLIIESSGARVASGEHG
jgi:cytidylate kinase